MPFDPDEFLKKTGGFDPDEFLKSKESIGATRDLPEPTPYDKYGTVGALFPATAKQEDLGNNKGISRAIATAGDAFSMLPRGVSAASTGLGALSGGKKLPEAYDEAMRELQKTKSDEKGVSGVAQNIALDPTTWAPAGKVAKGVKLVPSLAKALGRGVAYAAGSSAYQQSAEGKIDPTRTAIQGAVGGAVETVTGGLLPALGKSIGGKLTKGALKNVDVALKPGITGKKLGFLEENVIKHDLGIEPDDVFNKATEKLDILQKRAKEIAESSTETFNVADIFDSALKKIDRKSNPNAYTKQVEELALAKSNFIKAFGENVNASDAMKIRSRIGEETAFVGRTSAGAKVDPDASWKEDVYNDLYHSWKNQLHQKLGGELKDINKAQSELIPIRIVADKRNTIQNQNNRISLADMGAMGIGMGLAGGHSVAAGDSPTSGGLKSLATGAALVGGRRALGSKLATQMAYKLGNKLTQ